MKKNTKKRLWGLVIILIIFIAAGYLLSKDPDVSEKGSLSETGQKEQESELIQETLASVRDLITEEADMETRDPSGVVKAYYEALEKKNYTQAASYLSDKLKKEFERRTWSDIEEAMKLEAEKNENAGYTKLEIIEEGPVVVNYIILFRRTSSRSESGCYNFYTVKENNIWKVFGSLNNICYGISEKKPLPGKLEISPPLNTPQYAVLQFFKALYSGDHDEIKKYLADNGKEIIRKDLYSAIYPGSGRSLDSVTIEEALESYTQRLQREIDTIKGVIIGETNAGIKVKLCAEDVYCDQYGLKLQIRENDWEIINIHP